MIENVAAYESAIADRRRINGIVGRIQRLQDEAPMILRLITEVIHPEHRARYEANQARIQAQWEKASAAQNELLYDDVYNAQVYTPLFELDDPRLAAGWIDRLTWQDLEDFDFPTKLVLAYLKKKGGLSDKQNAWVAKMVEEEPNKVQAREDRQAAQKAADAASTHQGEVGERMKGLELQVSFVKTLDGGQYGPKRIVKLLDAAGNIFTTFATSAWVWDAEKGQALVLDGTVKQHDDYQGAAQTILTRTKVVGG